MKFKIDVDLSEIEELSRKYPEISKKVRYEKVKEALAYAKDRMIAYTPKCQGERSRDSIMYGPLVDGYNTAEYTPGTSVYGLIANNVWYGKIVEYGRKAGIVKKTWRVYSALPATHFFSKGISRIEGGIETILGEIPDAIIKEAEA